LAQQGARFWFLLLRGGTVSPPGPGGGGAGPATNQTGACEPAEPNHAKTHNINPGDQWPFQKRQPSGNCGYSLRTHVAAAMLCVPACPADLVTRHGIRIPAGGRRKRSRQNKLCRRHILTARRDHALLLSAGFKPSHDDHAHGWRTTSNRPVGLNRRNLYGRRVSRYGIARRTTAPSLSPRKNRARNRVMLILLCRSELA